jgi:hypothetical protein
MRILAAVVVTLCVLSPAQAEQRLILPPVEYDHPYDGELVTIIAESADQVRELCPTVPFKAGWPLGCSTRSATKCRVVLAREDIIVSYGWTLDIVRRHEIGHCNGWAGHSGARPANRKKLAVP